MSALIVNLYGAPGAGKSTMAANVFALLKWQGVNCELVTEYAKDKTWEKSYGVLGHQGYVFAKQLFRISRLEDQVDAIVTDAPLLHSLFYGQENTTQEFKNYVMSEYKRRSTLDIYVTRVKPYNPAGRSQTSEEASLVGAGVLTVLNGYGVFPTVVEGTPDAAERLAELIYTKVRR